VSWQRNRARKFADIRGWATDPDDPERPLEQFDDAVELCRAEDGHGEASIDALAVVQRNTPLFLRGDLVIVKLWNGQATRWPCVGHSSRGYLVTHAYMQAARWRDRGCWVRGTWARYPNGYAGETQDRYDNKSTIRLVDVPGDVPKTLDGGSAYDPVRLRGWLMEALRAGYAAGGVGTGSPALSLPFMTPKSPPRARRKQRKPYERW
jgi:hypothetical protein